MIDHKNLYELLGVDEEVTSDELKRAYRRLAHEHHPDKGGDAELFAEITQAYRILNDPGSRLLYDRTGKSGEKRIDEEIKSLLLESFKASLRSDSVQILIFVRRYIENGENQFKEAKEKLLEAREKFQKKRNLISTTLEENFFHYIIDEEFKNIESGLATIERKFEIAQACYEILKTYSEKNPMLRLEDILGSSSTGITYQSLGEMFEEQMRRKRNRGEE